MATGRMLNYHATMNLNSLWIFLYLLINLLSAHVMSNVCFAESLCNWEMSITDEETKEVRYYGPKNDKGESGPVKVKDGEKLVAQIFFSTEEPSKIGDEIAQTASALCTMGPDKTASIIQPRSIAIRDQNKKLRSFSTLFNIVSPELEITHTVRMYCREALK